MSTDSMYVKLVIVIIKTGYYDHKSGLVSAKLISDLETCFVLEKKIVLICKAGFITYQTDFYDCKTFFVLVELIVIIKLVYVRLNLILYASNWFL